MGNLKSVKTSQVGAPINFILRYYFDVIKPENKISISIVFIGVKTELKITDQSGLFIARGNCANRRTKTELSRRLHPEVCYLKSWLFFIFAPGNSANRRNLCSLADVMAIFFFFFAWGNWDNRWNLSFLADVTWKSIYPTSWLFSKSAERKWPVSPTLPGHG